MKMQKKKMGGSGPVGSRGVEGWGLVERRGLVGSNVGGRVGVGYRGCEPRIEGIVQCTKRYLQY